jgi:hypothetical protein
MGLLDDAIREHLDLKRRRGADPTDIERAEREALGPVRRDRFERAPDEFDDISVSDDRLRAYDQAEEPYDDEGYEEYGVEEEWEDELDDHQREQHVRPPETRAREGDFPDSARVMDHDYLEGPQPPFDDEPGGRSAYAPGMGDETVQYEVGEALASEPSRGQRAPEWVEQSEEWVEQSEEGEHGAGYGESPSDVDPAPRPPSRDPGADRSSQPRKDALEETPESPDDLRDDDRLWFEQHPRRDTDFDG